MSKCTKCGSEDILTRFVKYGELIDSSSTKRIENEFISSSEYDFFFQLKAKKDHLDKCCRCCQYNWCENTLDNQQ